jgi:hypothetical protein
MDAHEHEAAGAIAGMQEIYGSPAPTLGDWVSFYDANGAVLQGRVTEYGTLGRVWVTRDHESVLLWPRQLARA